MHLKVGQLDEYLAKRQENSFTATLGEFSVSDDATALKVDTGVTGANYTLDDSATAALAKYLNIPGRYLKMLDPDFRATTLRYAFEKHKSAPTTIESLNGAIVALHQPSQIMVPMSGVARVVTKVFNPDDTVRRMISSESRLHIDVTTSNHQIQTGVLEPTGDTMEGRQPAITHAVGDITEAGVRFLAHPFSSVAPSVNLYTERLICTNGQTTDERLGRISLKGNTVDDVINEMELAAQHILGQLDTYLEKLSATRTMEVPGSVQAFVQQLAKEANLNRKVVDRVLDIVNQLPQPVSVWDVNQAFTSVANEVDQYKTMMKLQVVGGDLGFDAERTLHRCKTCEQRLPQ
jgi:hypothetical protein